jgi:modification methylase
MANSEIIGAGQDLVHRPPKINTIYCENCLNTMAKMPDNIIDLIVTSPNYNNWRNKRVQAKRADYWKRTRIDYDVCTDKQTDEEYMNEQIKIINEMIRVLKPTGTICYNHKDKIFNFEVLSPLSWILKTNAKYRQRITWDRCGMQAYNPVRFFRVEEDIYILGKEAKKFVWNKEFAKYLSVWRIPPSRNVYGHPATFPTELVKRCIESFTNEKCIIYDPYMGSGTTAEVSLQMNRCFIGSEISEEYCRIAEERIRALRSPAQDTAENCHTAPNTPIEYFRI